MLNWLGQEGSRILKLHDWSPEDKQNKEKIIDALKEKCQSQENAHLYKQQFLLIRQGCEATFSDLYKEVCCIYNICMLEEEGRCSDHKDCTVCKKSARDIRISDILTLAVRDNDLRTEFRKLKDKDRTETRYHFKVQNGTWIMQSRISIMPLEQ